MIHIAICDDNIEQCNAILKKVTEMLPSDTKETYKLTPYVTTEEFKDALKENQFQIVFMDIDFGEGKENGILLSRRINAALSFCQIIFLTGHLEYVSQVYEVQHTYFVLKSEAERYLPLALSKALKNMERRQLPYLCIDNGRDILSIPQNDIIYLERDKRITRINTPTATYSTYKNLEDLHQKLSEELFVRCHRSFIVNLSYVRKMKRTGFLCEGDIEISISRSYYDEIKENFAAFIGKMI